MRSVMLALAAMLVVVAMTPSSVAAYSRCGLSNSVHFETWMNSFTTDSPVLFPTSDAELRSLLAAAASGGCKVRVVGTAHSYDGVVRQKLEEQTVVVNLGKYVPPASWNYALNTAQKTVRMGAGRTWLDLIGFVRPQGYLLPTQTAGYFFSLGGVLANPSVHGGGFGQDRMLSLMVAARVLLANGTFREVTDPAEIRYWRGSMGLLGLITAVEVKLRQDTGLLMTRESQSFPNAAWTVSAVSSFLQSSAVGKQHGEWFYNPYSDQITALMMDHDGAPGFNYASLTSYYAAQVAAYPNLATLGSQVTPTNGFVTLVNTLTDAALGAALVALGMSQTNDMWDDASAVRDGYYIPPSNLVKFDNVQTFIQCPSDCLTDNFAATVLDATRAYLQPIIKAVSTPWRLSLPCEFRFLDVPATSNLVLEHLRPGKRYMSMECVDMRDTFGENAVGPFFKGLEDVWRGLGANTHAAGHHGKQWGYGTIGALPNPYSFANDAVQDNFYTPAVKAQFNEKRLAYDPSGLFLAGAGARMIGVTAYEFDPRGLNGDSCLVYRDAQCIHGCCCNNVFGCVGGGVAWNECSDRRNGRFLSRCGVGCECSSGRCVFGLCF